MTTVDNLSALPTEVLMHVALELPINDVVSLCSTSQKLAKLCNNEIFWRQRIPQDFPQYAPSGVLPNDLSYKAYYQFLADIWNFQNANGKMVIDELEGDEDNLQSLTLLFPVPRFDLWGDRVYADVWIEKVKNSYLVFVGDSNRFTVLDRSIPSLGERIKVVREIPEQLRESKEHLLNKAQALGLKRSMFLNKTDLKKLLQEARDKGYVRLYTQDNGFITIPEALRSRTDLFNIMESRNERRSRRVRWSK